jgi:hypothetical protein
MCPWLQPYSPHQAVSKDGKSSSRLLVLLRITETTTGSLAPLMALKQADVSGAGGVTDKQLARADSDSDSDAGSGDEGPPKRRPDSPELHERLDSRCGPVCVSVFSFKECSNHFLQEGINMALGGTVARPVATCQHHRHAHQHATHPRTCTCCCTCTPAPAPAHLLLLRLLLLSHRLRTEQWLTSSFKKGDKGDREGGDADEAPHSPRVKAGAGPGARSGKAGGASRKGHLQEDEEEQEEEGPGGLLYVCVCEGGVVVATCLVDAGYWCVLVWHVP